MSSRKHQEDLKMGGVAAPRSWRFGDVTVDCPEGRLVRDGQPVEITPKAFDALVLLLTRHGQLVKRQELLDALWPDTHVGDASLTSIIWTIRRALGEAGIWIETVPKRGYRFVGQATELPSLSSSAEHDGSPPATANIEAFRLCLEGRTLCHAWPTAAFHRSRDLFERAIHLDPAYAEAYFGLALYHGIGAAMGLLPPVEGWRAFQVALAAAQRLDPTLPENLNGVAAAQLYLHRNWEGAEAAFVQALAADPDDGETRNHYGLSLALFGRFEKAVVEIRRAVELDPLSVRFQWNLASVLYQSGRYDDAIDQCRSTLSLDATYRHVHALMGDAYEQLSDFRRAVLHWRHGGIGYGESGDDTLERLWRGHVQRLLERVENGSFVPAMDLARAHAHLGDLETTIEWLSKALHERSRLVLELPVDPLFARFRHDPRFAQIVAALPNGRICRTPTHRPPDRKLKP